MSSTGRVLRDPLGRDIHKNWKKHTVFENMKSKPNYKFQKKNLFDKDLNLYKK